MIFRELFQFKTRSLLLGLTVKAAELFLLVFNSGNWFLWIDLLLCFYQIKLKVVLDIPDTSSIERSFLYLNLALDLFKSSSVNLMSTDNISHSCTSLRSYRDIIVTP